MAVLSAGELNLSLQRDGCKEPFGFRLRGGTDIREAFIIQRVILETKKLYFQFIVSQLIWFEAFKDSIERLVIQRKKNYVV